MSTPVITLTSPSKTGMSISYPPEITKNTRDPSFSSYLDGSEETFVLKLGGATTHRVVAATTAAITHDHAFVGKKKSDDREIDVFDAEKYFNEGLMNHSPKVVTRNSSKKDDLLEILAAKEKSTKSVGTLSIRSESSSNSRSALLNTIPRKQHTKKAANKKSFLTTIGCNCSCADKNSVAIEENTVENAKSRKVDHKTRDHLIRKSLSEYTCVRFEEPELRVNSENHFSFPVLNQTAKVQPQDNGKKKNNNSNKCLSLEEKLTMMTWDAIADQETKIIPRISNDRQTDNDSDSDASSDLFEIESLSKGNNSSYLSRQASDGMSCLTPRTCYAPSEASIEWSVVTASAADFSVLSDSDDLKHSKTKEVTKLRPSILSGCKSDKAVGVVGDAHNRPSEQVVSNSKRHLNTGGSFTRFHEEIKVASFDARMRRQSFDARVLLPQSRTGSGTAHLLYT